jgi:hypothetical protein
VLCGAFPAATIALPMNDERVQLEMELDPGSDPIRGTLADSEGKPHPFSGWIELAALIERARLTTPYDDQEDRT